MTRAAILVLICLLPPAARGDDVTARKNFARELADCSALYQQASEQDGLGPGPRQQLAAQSLSALQAAAGVSDRRFAITEQQRALAGGGTVSSGLCDQIMAHPNERFAYWRGH